MKIYILTIGTRGDVQPYIALGVGLKAIGNEVTIATSTEFESLITERGLYHAPLRGDFLKVAQVAENESAGNRRGNSFQLIKQYREMARDTLADEWKTAQTAEVIIYNPATFGGYGIAEKLGVPAFSAFPAPLYSPTREFPSPFFPFPNLGPFNKLSHRLFARLGPSLFRRAINEWRKDELGLPPAKGNNLLHGKPIMKLYAYSEAVVPRPADWDESSVVTGYWFLDAPRNWRPEPALMTFISEGPPPVYVGFGSMSMYGGAYRTELVVKAISLAGQRLILANAEEGRSSEISKDIFVINSVPHDWLFPQMAAVVHHGGAGTTGASLRAGKPTVICPFVGDQTFWGRRVAALGAGPAPIPKGKLTAESLADAINHAVTDEGMCHRAASLGEHIRAEDGVSQAIALINNQIESW
jgi:UDP:flavonoid glycosyltransferase YjiC (YdhE family)